MKLENNTLLLILAILFILICGLSYFFYTKYKSTMEYINKQLNLKLGNYDFTLKKQLTEMMEQYKNYIVQDKPIFKNPEEEQVINNLFSELQSVNEDDLQLELPKQLEDIVEETVVEQELEDFDFDHFDNEIEDIHEEISEEEISEEEMKDLVMDDDLPFISSDDEDLVQFGGLELLDTEEDIEVTDEEIDNLDYEFDNLDYEFDLVEEPVETETEPIDSLNVEIDDFVIEEKMIHEDRCNYIMPRGKRKGEICDKKVSENNKCTKHYIKEKLEELKKESQRK